jgi:phage baseplate assembly protein W
MATLYKGFSTIDRYKKFRITDIDLIKQDLTNHFSIRKGEKLMQPDFGTIIWSLLFEPMTDAVHQAIVEDVTQIVKYDPRTNLQNITINEYQNGIQIAIDLLYIPTDQITSLNLQFDSNSQNLTTSTLV